MLFQSINLLRDSEKVLRVLVANLIVLLISN